MRLLSAIVNFRILFKRVIYLSPVLLTALACRADSIITLTDGTAALTVDTGSSAGMSAWTLNGDPNAMPQQWVWFRTGSNPLQSLDTLGSSSNDFDPSFPGSVDVQYQSSALSAVLSLELVDGSPTVMSEQLQFTNLSTTDSVALTIVQYIHFRFSTNSDSATISGNDATQQGARGSVQIGSAPFGSLYQVSPASVLLSDLTGATSSSFNLNDQASGSGDVAIAFEWQTTLPANGSTILSIDESLTAPEPVPMLLFGMGVAALYGLRTARRRKA